MNITLSNPEEYASFWLFRRGGTEVTCAKTEDGKHFFVEIPDGNGYFVLIYLQNEHVGLETKWDSKVPYGRSVFGKGGTIELRDTSQNFDVIKTVEVRFAGVAGDDDDNLSEDILNLALQERLQIRQALEENFDYLNEVTKLMHLNTFWCTEGPVPAYYFMELSAPPLSHEFVLNLLNIASEMNGYTSQEILQNLSNDKITFDTYRVIEELLTITGTTCFYNGDRSYYTEDGAEQRPVERMMTPFSSGFFQGDCEDVAKESHMLTDSIRRMENPGNLAPLVNFLRRYEFGMVTIVATAPSLQRRDAPETTDPTQYICHVVSCGFPKGWFEGEKSGLEILWLEATNFTEGFHSMTQAEADKKYRREAFRAKLPPTLKKLGYVLPAPVTRKRPKTMAEQSVFYRWATGVWLRRRVPFQVFVKDGKVGVTLTDLLEQNGVTLKGVLEPLLSPADRQAILASEIPRKRGQAYASAEIIKEWSGECSLTKDFVDIRLQHPNELTEEVWEGLKQVSGYDWVECVQVRKHTIAMNDDRGAYQIQVKIAIKENTPTPEKELIAAQAMYP